MRDDLTARGKNPDFINHSSMKIPILSHSSTIIFILTVHFFGFPKGCGRGGGVIGTSPSPFAYGCGKDVKVSICNLILQNNKY
jgi:uncharacterized spore protein YtfJ